MYNTYRGALEGQRLTPLQVFASALAISSFAGLAALLRSNQPITLRAVFSSVCYSGAMGTIIAMLWMKKYGLEGDPYFLLGVAGLAGIGGVNLVDLAIIAARRSGIKLVFSREEHDQDGMQHETRQDHTDERE